MTELKHSIQPNQQYITEVKSELGIALARKRCFWHLLKLGSSRVLQLLSPLSAYFLGCTTLATRATREFAGKASPTHSMSSP